MRLRSSLVLLLGCLPAALLAAPAAQARTGPCAPVAHSPACRFWDARVVQISDGDTIKVRLAGDRRRRIQAVRFVGINAMEMTRYSNFAARRRGACHAIEATAVVDRLVRGARWRVRLAAQHESSRSGGRLRRSVWVRAGGRWVDVGREVIARGLALWLPNSAEWAHDREYHALAEAARAKGIGLWNPASCGAGPEQDARLEVRVKYDADGNDARNLDGEWAQVLNRGTRAVSLAGWWLRDSDLRPGPGHAVGYRFPPVTAIPAGGSIRVHSGCGRSGGADFFWCQRAPVFDNPSYDERAFGDGGYLFDPQGDLRASITWPCLTACADPLAGKLRISAHPRSPESVAITNVSGGAVSLDGHLLDLHLRGHPGSYIFSAPFPAGEWLGPGETLVVDPGGSPSRDSRLSLHLGRGPNQLADGGNAVSVRSFTDTQAACDAWGSWHC